MSTASRKAPERIALFGTSADPPHVGHQSILLWLAREFDRVLVWAADNPYKEKQSPIHNRAQMLRLLIETLPETLSTEGTKTLGEICVDQQLSDRFSIHSIIRAKQLWPKAKFSFVVGADLIAQLPNWYRAREIFSLVDILVFPRPGYPIEGPALSTLRELATVHIAQPPYQHDISSSDFRQAHCLEQISNKQISNRVTDNKKDKIIQTNRQNSDLIPPIIRDYITEHDLYPCLQSTLHPQETSLKKRPLAQKATASSRQ